MPTSTYDNGSIAFMLVATALVMDHDPRPRLLFTAAWLAEKRARHHDPELRLHGLDHLSLVGVRLFAGIQRWKGRGDRRFALCVLTGCRAEHDPCRINNMPLLVLFVYQMMFAIITPALITGAFANRIVRRLHDLSHPLVAVRYFPDRPHGLGRRPVCSRWGVSTFAGGTAVHASAGFAALASVLFVGKRKFVDKGPHSIPLVALGRGCSGSAGMGSTPVAK